MHSLSTSFVCKTLGAYKCSVFFFKLINKQFSGTGGNGIKFLRGRAGMEWDFYGDGWGWKRNCTGTGGDGHEIWGTGVDGCNFCPRAGL